MDKKVDNKNINAKKKWKSLADNIGKKLPNFLKLQQKNTAKLIKNNGEEIIINCDNTSHTTIPDSVFNYLCSLPTINNKRKTEINNNIIPDDKNVNVIIKDDKPKSSQPKKTKSKTQSKGGKKTRKK